VVKFKYENEIIEFRVFDDDWIGKVIERWGTWEPGVTKYFIDLIRSKRHAHFIDCGAYFGYYARLFQHFSHDNYTAIEANPITYYCVLNHNLLPHHCVNRFITSSIDEWSPPLSMPLGNMGGCRAASDGILKVRCAKLNDYLREDTDLIKMDLEGGEFDALRSCRPFLLEKHPTIIAELSPSINKSGADSLLELLTGCGYTIYDIGSREADSYDVGVYPNELFTKCEEQTNIVALYTR